MIGINTAIFSESGGSQGRRLRRPEQPRAPHRRRADQVRRGAPRVDRRGDRPDAHARDRRSSSEYLPVDARRGRGRACQNSSAYQAGLRLYDVIVAFNGETIETGEQFVRAVADSTIGSTATHRRAAPGPPDDLKVPVTGRNASSPVTVLGVDRLRRGAPDRGRPGRRRSPAGRRHAAALSAGGHAGLRHRHVRRRPRHRPPASTRRRAVITLNAVDLDVYRAEIAAARRPAAPPRDHRPTPPPRRSTFTMPTRLLPGTLKLHVEYGGRLRTDGRGFYLARRLRAEVRAEPDGGDRRAPRVPVVRRAGVHGELRDFGGRRRPASPPSRTAGSCRTRPGLDSGKHTLRFGTTPRMSSYLVALAVGEFQCLERDGRGMPLRACAAPEKQDLGRFALDVVEQAFRAESRYFTLRYPFRKLDLVAVPGGFEGAVGITGAIVCDEQLLADPDAASEPALGARRRSPSRAEWPASGWAASSRSAWWDDLWIARGARRMGGAEGRCRRGGRSGDSTLSSVARTNAAMSVDSLPSDPSRAGRGGDRGRDRGGRSTTGPARKAAAIFRMVEAWLGRRRRPGRASTPSSAPRPTSRPPARSCGASWRRRPGQPVDRVMRPAVTAARRPGGRASTRRATAAKRW